MTLLPDLLRGVRVAVGGDGSCATAASDGLRALGATVDELPVATLADEDAAAAWACERAPLDGLVYDAGAGFGTGGAEALRGTMELTWRAIRAVATGALIESGLPGRIVLVAPRPDAGPHAVAGRAALENLARTLSVEWARHQITAVVLWPGSATTDAALAQMTCFLLSPAGGYFSGCRFELDSVAVAAR